jgi:hypothetical protein
VVAAVGVTELLAVLLEAVVAADTIVLRYFSQT